VPLQAVYEELEQLSWEVKMAQSEAGIDFPVHLSREIGGLVETWVNGMSWRDICKETSLDQGDLCRILRRTVEILRQIPEAYGVPPNIVQTAYKAASKMDRFPVAELDSIGNTEGGDKKTDTAGVGFGNVGDNSVEFSELQDFLFPELDDEPDDDSNAENRVTDDDDFQFDFDDILDLTSVTGDDSTIVDTDSGSD
jgi:DSHCT (NUC185) domain